MDSAASASDAAPRSGPCAAADGPFPPRRVTRAAPLALLAALALGACAPYATLHAPRPIPPGETQWGAGIAAPAWFLDEDENWTSALTASLRAGVGARTDLGLRVGLVQGVSVDVKQLLLDGPLSVSMDLAVSAGPGLGVHPALLLGTERVYGGAKWVTFPAEREANAVLFGGMVLGRDLRLVPEVALVQADGLHSFLSLEVQYRRRRSTHAARP